MNHPNPEIYREAARLLAHRGQGYSCPAIKAVCESLCVSYSQTVLYGAQYIGAFGLEPAADTNVTPCGDSWIIDSSGVIPVDHPYWNSAPSKKRNLELRILALLFMAELVANP